MKNLFLACALLLLSRADATSFRTPHHPLAATAPVARAGATVYSCNNGSTAVYHPSLQCAALRRCTHEVLTTTAAQAQASGKRACLKCR